MKAKKPTKSIGKKKPSPVKTKKKVGTKVPKKPLKKAVILPPILYRRPIPNGMYRQVSSMYREIECGTILEFVYGKKQKPGQVGGWKNDRKPVLLVFYDNKVDGYIEGINTNYLSMYYLKKLKQIMTRFPGVDGEELYTIMLRTARFAVNKGYRKYIRSSLKNVFTFEYYDDDIQELQENKSKKK